MKTSAAFLKRFITNPRRVGALIPSGPVLVRKMLRDLPLEQAHTVVELGPGLGAFTQAILPRLQPETDFFVVEIDPFFAQKLREQFPRLHVIEDSAEYLADHLDELGHDGVDIVISALPFTNLPREMRQRIIANVATVLRPGGHFVTFQYLHARAMARDVEKVMRNCFPYVAIRLTMSNVAPVFLFHART